MALPASLMATQNNPSGAVALILRENPITQTYPPVPEGAEGVIWIGPDNPPTPQENHLWLMTG